MDGGAWQCKYINVNIRAYNDTKNKVKNEDNTHIVNKKPATISNAICHRVQQRLKQSSKRRRLEIRCWRAAYHAAIKAKQKQAKMCNGRRHVPLSPASANEKYIVQKCNYNTMLSSVFNVTSAGSGKVLLSYSAGVYRWIVVSTRWRDVTLRAQYLCGETRDNYPVSQKKTVVHGQHI